MSNTFAELKKTDPDVYEAMRLELHRLNDKLEMIASENFTSEAVMEAQGSVLTNKYAEGYPGRRYYGGCEYVDIVENLAIDRVKELFGAEAANVQPHSGSQANVAVYSAFLKPGDKILAMDLSAGGHLTHGSPVNFSGKLYDVYAYGVDRETQLIDYDDVAKKAEEVQPKMIVAGASAYSRTIDFAKMREIADSVGAYLFVDMAHIAGLVAAGLHPNPVPYADFVTSTTHKTLRGPRGGLILTTNEHIRKINSSVFPGNQGGPLMHVIAAKAVAFKEALTPEFKEYQQHIVDNAKALADGLRSRGQKLVSNGTDNHLLVIDLTETGISGKTLQDRLDEVNITTNKNSIPFDEASPVQTSGLRLGTPALTTRGLNEADMDKIAEFIHLAIIDFANQKENIINGVKGLTDKYPLYTELRETVL